jgi:hypothetical protein
MSSTRNGAGVRGRCLATQRGGRRCQCRDAFAQPRPRSVTDKRCSRRNEAHLRIAEAFLQDASVDAVVVALDPTAPAVRALERSNLRPGHDINDAASTAARMPPLAARFDKPLIGVIDAGRLYDAFAARLMDQGVCIFRNCARATTALAHYIEARRYAAVLASKPEETR